MVGLSKLRDLWKRIEIIRNTPHFKTYMAIKRYLERQVDSEISNKQCNISSTCELSLCFTESL